MNWGYKIMLVYIVFIAGILVLVVKSSSQKVELVTKDYYEQELKYQQKIDQAKRAQSLSGPVKYEVSNNEIIISFPDEMKGVKLDAHVLLYYAADEIKDLKYDVSTEDGELKIPYPDTSKGMYELKMDWEANNINYYSEHKFFIQ